MMGGLDQGFWQSLMQQMQAQQQPQAQQMQAQLPQVAQQFPYPGLPSGVAAPAPYGWTPGQRPYVDTSRFAGMPQSVTQRQAFTPMSNGMNAYLRGQQRASNRSAMQAMSPPGRKGAY